MYWSFVNRLPNLCVNFCCGGEQWLPVKQALYFVLAKLSKLCTLSYFVLWNLHRAPKGKVHTKQNSRTAESLKGHSFIPSGERVHSSHVICSTNTSAVHVQGKKDVLKFKTYWSCIPHGTNLPFHTHYDQTKWAEVKVDSWLVQGNVPASQTKYLFPQPSHC